MEPDLTICALLDRALRDLSDLRGDSRDPYARELSLAITHVEDARMRYVRARCMQEGVFNDIDIDGPGFGRAKDNAAAALARGEALGAAHVDHHGRPT